MTLKRILSVLLLEAAFIGLSLYAKSHLDSLSIVSNLMQGWYFVWLAGQLALIPFMVRLLASHGLGQGIALLNGFSIVLAVAGGYFLLGENLQLKDIIATGLVCLAVYLFATRRSHR